MMHSRQNPAWCWKPSSIVASSHAAMRWNCSAFSDRHSRRITSAWSMRRCSWRMGPKEPFSLAFPRRLLRAGCLVCSPINQLTEFSARRASPLDTERCC